MIGIYCFTNKTNGKKYVGQSVDIEKRKKQHFLSAKNKNAPDYNYQFHQAIRKYGEKNFDFEILQSFSEIDKNNMNEAEKYYIKKFDCYKNGYNMTSGGDSSEQNLNSNERNGKAKLRLEDVIEIREAYNQKKKKRDVYLLYKDRIGLSGFSKIWDFTTWKNILPQYHNEENIRWHSTEGRSLDSKQAALNAGKITEEEVLKVREMASNGVAIIEIREKLDLKISTSEISKIIRKEKFQSI